MNKTCDVICYKRQQPSYCKTRDVPLQFVVFCKSLMVHLEGLKGNADTLPFAVEGRPPTVPTVDGRVYLYRQQLCCTMHIRSDLYS